ncbi:zinc ribbon domain-containing protein [Lentisphaera profundi]|uniref:Zinc ribbon domain-containing protein n=1 Tax=Lentisphaera profundi TaxID=1658616 RepID=A0ABY7W1U7_9BACT|nr:zinc ribbon domain-containing protein [Lentisphaera profundi]WDE98248.1 zinc ribbon domain-containing protein [Lentisphaera profundi]
MEIQCDKCGNQNPLGAIFCRTCGEKLEMKELNPKVSNSATKSKMSSFVLRQLISLIVFILIALIGVGAFLKQDVPSYEDELKKDVVVKKQKYLFNRLNKVSKYMRLKKLSLTEAEAAAVVNYDLKSRWESDEGKAAAVDAIVVPQEFYVKILDSERLKFILRVKLNKGFETDLYSSVTYKIVNDEEAGTAEFVLDGTSQGWVPVPTVASMTIQANFKSMLAESDKPEEMVKQIASIELDPEEGLIVINFVEPPKKKK